MRRAVVALFAAVAACGVAVSAARAGETKIRRPVLEFEGRRSMRTPVIRLPSTWALAWSFDCAAVTAGPGLFSVEVVPVGAAPKYGDRIPRLARFDTRGSGVERYDVGGYRAFLRVASQCSWTLRAMPLRA